MNERLERIEAQLETILTLLHEARSPREVIYPAKKIAEALGCHVRTLNKWAAHPVHPLKMVHSGAGLTTTRLLISQWILDRWEHEQTAPRVGKLFGRTRRAEGQRKIRIRIPMRTPTWETGEMEANSARGRA